MSQHNKPKSSSLNAVEAVANKAIKKASNQFNLPTSTLKNYVKNVKKVKKAV